MISSTRIWVVACVAAMIAVLAGGWFLGVQPQFAAAADAATSTANVEAQNQATIVRLAQLSKAAAKTDSLREQNAVLLKSVPTILKPNTFIRRVNEVAAIDGVTVASVAFADAAAYTAPTTADGAGLALGKVDPAISAANFAAVPTSVSVTGTEASVFQFSHDIQNDERVFAINGVQTNKNEVGAVTATFSGYIYTLKR